MDSCYWLHNCQCIGVISMQSLRASLDLCMLMLNDIRVIIFKQENDLIYRALMKHDAVEIERVKIIGLCFLFTCIPSFVRKTSWILCQQPSLKLMQIYSWISYKYTFRSNRMDIFQKLTHLHMSLCSKSTLLIVNSRQWITDEHCNLVRSLEAVRTHTNHYRRRWFSLFNCWH